MLTRKEKPMKEDDKDKNPEIHSFKLAALLASATRIEIGPGLKIEQDQMIDGQHRIRAILEGRAR